MIYCKMFIIYYTFIFLSFFYSVAIYNFTVIKMNFI
uniref:Uncharacterized protein n=1 Tax=Inkyuleea mariana TaxID=123988 RepID=A0A4D6X047_9FLOR|nr:hypothetical protein [Inkyuleea mariana]